MSPPGPPSTTKPPERHLRSVTRRLSGLVAGDRERVVLGVLPGSRRIRAANDPRA